MDQPAFQPDAPVESRPGVPSNVEDTGIQNVFPVWSLLDVLRVAVVFIVAIFFTTIVAFLVAASLPAYRAMKTAQAATDPRIIVPAQVVASLLTLWFVYRMLVRHYRQPFFKAVEWNWPSHWGFLLVLGVLLSLGLQLLSTRLPIPKSLPIDQFFKLPSGLWLMAIYGTLIAPFSEELFFRGLMFPALQRTAGVTVALLLTSLSFALLHASQLGWSFAALTILFIVGFVLTLVRMRTKSLASSVIVHSGYNGFIFVLLFISTHAFRRF